ncbi:protein adenylyltransferase Fic [Aerococcus sanguinicola]|nr:MULTISPECIES: Fic family protein [Aerococcus]
MGVKMMKNEEYQTKRRAHELWDLNLIDEFEVGSFRGLADIHAYLFQDFPEVHPGEVRQVNLSKGNFRFASVLYLESAIQAVEAMPENNFDAIIDKYTEMNVVHPFREGNGRSTRIWLDQILKENLSICIDWSLIDKRDYLSAMALSPANNNLLKMLLKNALTDEVDNRLVYMKGIDQSYAYEDMADYPYYEIEGSNGGESDGE